MSNPVITAFCARFEQNREPPAGRLESGEAPKVNSSFGVSLGRRKWRLCFDALPDERFKIAACLHEDNPVFGGDYRSDQVKVDGAATLVSLNISSLQKRFDLPEEVCKTVKLPHIIRLVRERGFFQAPLPDSLEEDGATPLLKPGSLILPGEMMDVATLHDRSFRLSKSVCHLERSIDVLPGFVAFAGPLIQQGAHAKAKCYTTLDNLPVVRRSVCLGKIVARGEKMEAVLSRYIRNGTCFQGKTGVLQTLAAHFYVNKRGMAKFASYHPLYEMNLEHLIFFQNRHMAPLFFSRAQSLRLALQLLEGLSAIAEQGVHRDLVPRNIFLSSTPSCDAVIGDLQGFRTKEEMAQLGPLEVSGASVELAQLGSILYYLFRQNQVVPPWAAQPREYPLLQEHLDRFLSGSYLPPQLKDLLRGLLALDPKERWSLERAIQHLKSYMEDRVVISGEADPHPELGEVMRRSGFLRRVKEEPLRSPIPIG